MNLGLFSKFMAKKGSPSQQKAEWRTFLEICEMHLKKHEINSPIVVELGIWKNRQKRFYEKFLWSHYIGIDFTNRRATPDILGNTHNPETIEELKKRLEGKPINILFIDAGHRYEYVKKDFELYSPLCSDIIAIHDIESCRYGERKGVEVWKFWDELKAEAYKGIEAYKDFVFLSIYQHRDAKNKVQMGIGMILKR